MDYSFQVFSLGITLFSDKIGRVQFGKMSTKHQKLTSSLNASSSAESPIYKIQVRDGDSNLRRTFKIDSIFDFESFEKAVISRFPDFARSRLEYSYRGESILQIVEQYYGIRLMWPVFLFSHDSQMLIMIKSRFAMKRTFK